MDGKSYRRTELEKHYAVVGEPGEFYLTHLTLDYGKGVSIAKPLFSAIENTDLQINITTVGSNGTAVMTGAQRVHPCLGRDAREAATVEYLPFTLQRTSSKTCICRIRWSYEESRQFFWEDRVTTG